MYKINSVDLEKGDFWCLQEETLLDAACRQGIFIPYACKGGGCGMCKIRVVEGNYERGLCSKAVLSDPQRVEHYTLACKTFPRSDLKVNLRLER